jgi:hypothetical protein
MVEAPRAIVVISELFDDCPFFPNFRRGSVFRLQ